jgi:hypothetical protein
MEIAFKFNSGETPQQIVAAITGFFGVVNQGSHVAPVVSPGTPTLPTTPPAQEEEPGVAANPSTIDATGIPYDARIHSDPPQMTTKNIWRKKRGVADTLVASVTAELKAKVGSVAQPPAPAAPPALAPVMPPASAPLAPPPLAQDDYTKFVTFLSSHMAPTGRLTPEYVNNYLAQCGYKDAQGNGSLQVAQTAPPEHIKQLATAFAQALGVASPV